MFNRVFHNETKDPVILTNNYFIILSSTEALLTQLHTGLSNEKYLEIMEDRYKNVETIEDIQEMALMNAIKRRDFNMGQRN